MSEENYKFVRMTGQGYKVWIMRILMALVVCNIVIYVLVSAGYVESAFLVEFSSGTVFLGLLLLYIAVQIFFIKCPRCRVSIYQHQMKDSSIWSRIKGLRPVEYCPKCEYGKDPEDFNKPVEPYS